MPENMQEMTQAEKIATIGRVCHAANKAWNDAHGEETLPWEDIGQSVMSGVEGILKGNTAEQSHLAWCEYKTAEGWVYGAVKDAEAKTHPCLVPYDQLPPEQRVKDELFFAIVHALTPALRLT